MVQVFKKVFKIIFSDTTKMELDVKLPKRKVFEFGQLAMMESKVNVRLVLPEERVFKKIVDEVSR